MKKFPKKLELPFDVVEERALRQRELVRSASWGVFIRAAIIVFELLGVWLFASSALLLDAMASIVDVFSSLLLIIFLKLASRPPDSNHPFGHGRYEPLIGVQLGLVLLVVGAGMFVQQLYHFFDDSPAKEIDGHAWIFAVIAVILLEVSYQVVMRAAKRQHSPAMVADAYHYRVDAITSLFAAIALIFAAFLPSWSHWIDLGGALLIALLMIYLGATSAMNNIHQLLDRAPDQSFFNRVSAAAKRAEGVLETEKIGIQLYGPDAHVDIDVEVDPNLTVEVAHKISQKVRLEIQKEWPAVRDVIVHIEPFYPNDH
jgi:cation diffusion facilitator family transporter